SRSSVARWRTGERIPPLALATRMASVLKESGVEVSGIGLVLAELREIVEQGPHREGALGTERGLFRGTGRADIVTAVESLARLARKTNAPDSFRGEVSTLAKRLIELVEAQNSSSEREVTLSRDAHG